MANTLTDLTPDIYQAMDTVSRELVGFIPAVTINSSLSRAAKDQVVRSHIAPASTAADITPGQLAPNTGDQTIANRTLSITKERAVPIRWNGNEQYGMDSGPGYNSILTDQFKQAFRTLTNEMETDLAALYVKASRGVGPSGTTLFDAATTVYKDVANVRKILVDNGAPLSDLQLVLNTKAGAALRGNPQYAGANTSGNEVIQRQGVLLDLSGMTIRESAQAVEDHTVGTESSAVTTDDGYAVGSTTINLKSATGTGTIAAGDLVTFDGDSNQYVVITAEDDVAGGAVVIQEPGLRQAIPAAETAIAITAGTDRNMAFYRGAIHLASRAPALPREGDSADDRFLMQDPHSGLVFEISVYKERRQVHYEVSAAWGVEMMQPRHSALLID